MLIALECCFFHYWVCCIYSNSVDVHLNKILFYHKGVLFCVYLQNIKNNNTWVTLYCLY